MLPPWKKYTYLQHCHATSVTGQIVANRLPARPVGRCRATGIQDLRFESAGVSQHHPQHDYRVQGRVVLARQTKISPADRLPIRSGKRDTARVRYLCSELMRVNRNVVIAMAEGKLYSRVSKGKRILRRRILSFLLADRSSAQRSIRVGQFASLLRNKCSPFHPCTKILADTMKYKQLVGFNINEDVDAKKIV